MKPSKVLLLSVVLVIATAFASYLYYTKMNKVPKVDENTRVEIYDAILYESKFFCGEFEVTKNVEFNDSTMLFWGINLHVPGDRRFFVPIKVTYKTFVDLDKLRKEDIYADSEGNVTIVMPEPECIVIGSEIDWDNEVEEISFYRSRISEAEKAALVHQGEMEIKKRFKKDDYIKEVRHGVIRNIKAIVSQFGFDEDNINVILQSNERKQK